MGAAVVCIILPEGCKGSAIRKHVRLRMEPHGPQKEVYFVYFADKDKWDSYRIGGNLAGRLGVYGTLTADHPAPLVAAVLPPTGEWHEESFGDGSNETPEFFNACAAAWRKEYEHVLSQYPGHRYVMVDYHF